MLVERTVAKPAASVVRPGTLIAVSLILALMPVIASAATVYRHVDEQGNVSYSDRPQRGEAVTLSPLTVVPAPPQASSPSASNGASNDQRSSNNQSAAPPFLPYSTFRIASPKQEQTLPTGYAGNVQVELSIEPELRDDHQVRLLVDGQVSQSALHSPVFMVTGLERGEHQLVAELLDAEGRVRHRSEPVTLFVQRASVNLPRNPNNAANASP
ncbi:DUF4124 domain-containing protein [Halomonas salinarum]|uniref:DUF4124 domain-containing protein n=1 Tax=Halomonas salinarum TaxID=1158993 RepID=UPI001FD7DA52|nr:DUF4124 domain-containing protein [Halomonas salinarum]